MVVWASVPDFLASLIDIFNSFYVLSPANLAISRLATKDLFATISTFLSKAP
mgnify:FL=1